ncbi:MAG: inositol monophosphatase [Gemmatimonadetes bacterium]|nr:inositol monophosphatase [Gemmatimonadota bacterium]
MNNDRVLATARAAAAAAASVHHHHLRSFGAEAWAEKGWADFVTHVDREAEAVIVDRVRADFPGHAVLAEEASTAPGANADTPDAEWLWVVDPLDGTTNYLHAYPMYAVSIAVLHRGRPVAGVVRNTASGEEWFATHGGGAYWNGAPIHVSAIDRLEQSLIGTGFPFKVPRFIPEYLPQLGAVLRVTSGVRRAGAAAVDLCHVAMGALDGFWELSLAPWDVAAGVLMIREAGGVVTRLDGNHDVIGPGAILAGNPHIHTALGAILAAVRGS